MSLVSVRRHTVLAISALFGLIVALGLLYGVNRASAVETVPVIVAAQPIGTGTTLEASLLKVQDWPAHLKPFVAASDIGDVIGKVTREELVTGEPILPGKLFLAGEGGSLSDRLTRGERGLSIVVNEIVGVDAKSLAGAFVDVLVTIRQDNGEAESKLVAERLRVLAVNQSADPRRPQPVKQLTLGVTLEQATAIEAARLQGPLSALLRHARDLDQQTPSPAAATSVTPSESQKRISPVKARPTIELIVGAERVSQ